MRAADAHSGAMRLRGLLWLIALVALAFPPLSRAATAVAVHGDGAMAAMSDCPDHPPPPDPCPANGTAKHAAGDCCPMMSGAIAVLPEGAAADVRPATHIRVTSIVTRMSGLLFTKDPPPPRA